jgi:hypothetical protein
VGILQRRLWGSGRAKGGELIKNQLTLKGVPAIIES